MVLKNRCSLKRRVRLFPPFSLRQPVGRLRTFQRSSLLEARLAAVEAATLGAATIGAAAFGLRGVAEAWGSAAAINPAL